LKRRAKGKRAGVTHRSGFDAAIRKDLDGRKVPYLYEPRAYRLVLDVPRHVCGTCGSPHIQKNIKYTPDFVFPNGLVVEAKGKFTARDRKVALAFYEQSGLEYRILFQRDNKLNPRSSSRYSDWCDAAGIQWAVGTEVPK
jgi:hypothetical protein